MWPRTALAALAILLMSASLVFAKTGRDALFFLEDGLFDLPEAYIGIALLSFPTAMLALATMRRFGPRRARVVGPLLTAAILTGFFFIVRPGGGPIMTGFFMFIPLAFGVVFAMTWLLASDLLGHVPRDRLGRPYSLIGAAAIGGGVVAGSAGRALSMHVAPRVFLLLGAVCLATSGSVVLLAQRYHAPSAARTIPIDPKGGIRTALGQLAHQRYVLLLLGIAIAAALTGILVEFQFYLGAATSGNDDRENAALFATLYTFLNLGALAVQLLLVPELQRRVGIGGSLLVLPTVLVGGGLALFANASLPMRSGLRATEGGLKSSIHRSNWEQAFLPLAERTRGAAKLLVDGAATRIGEGLAAGIVFAWLTFVVRGEIAGRDTTWVTAMIVGTAALWLVLVRRFRSLIRLAAPGLDASGRPVPGVALPPPDT